jgi:hypothetical protein
MNDASEQRAREPISTRIERDALQVITKVAAERRTTPSQVARVLLEDGARQLAAGA